MTDSSNQQFCKNCNAPILSSKSRFCQNCGARMKSPKLDFKSIFSDFLSTTFSLDNGFIPTFVDQWVPGKISGTFFRSNIKYSSPFKFFFITTILFFSVQGIISHYVEKEYTQAKAGRSGHFQKYKPVLNFQQSEDVQLLDSLRIRFLHTHPEYQKPISVFLYEYFNNHKIRVINDSLENHPDLLEVDTPLNVEMDSISWDNNSMFFNLDKVEAPSISLHKDSTATAIAYRDLFYRSPQSILKKYRIESFVGKIIIARMSKLLWEYSSIPQVFMQYFTWFLIANIPLFALFMTALYWRKKRFFVEHLVFILYSVSTILFIVLFIYALSLFIVSDTVQIFAFFLFPALYFYLSMKQFYKQGYIKTGIKFLLFIGAGIISSFFTFLAYSLIILLIT